MHRVPKFVTCQKKLFPLIFELKNNISLYEFWKKKYMFLQFCLFFSPQQARCQGGGVATPPGHIKWNTPFEYILTSVAKIVFYAPNYMLPQGRILAPGLFKKAGRKSLLPPRSPAWKITIKKSSPTPPPNFPPRNGSGVKILFALI